VLAEKVIREDFWHNEAVIKDRSAQGISVNPRIQWEE